MSVASPRTTQFFVRRVLIGTSGLVLIVLGITFGLASIPITDVALVALWLLFAVALHDAVLAPLVAVAASFALPLADVIGPVLTRITRASLVASACAALIMIPGIAVRMVGPRNSSIHMTDYLFIIAVLWLTTLAVSGFCILLGLWRASRRPKWAR
ncbi:hypothetical protein FHX49_000047 [Microbacterium endophyticum]|uniref:Uncharacterized protein n=1 Tax=Microbacterium endophyticum TaxID=1526412 RepID=A0A7W4V095_9MICO|nr:hypothetical protein [Microbacterium endophyticum]MBB2974506.1 hypothetical protein [Microbacterium endophyticum]NIK36803.1 hypothetical protein [Microbacterium endophyticum]